MPTRKRITNSTLAEAQGAARKLFHEAATPQPGVCRFYASKSKHFAAIERLDPTRYADLAAWLFLLDPQGGTDRWIGFGINAWDQLLSYSYARLSHSNDESLARLMDAFRADEFRSPSDPDFVAILRSLIKRNEDHPLSDQVMADVKARVKRDAQFFTRVTGLRQRAGRVSREMKQLYRELLKAVEQKRERPGQASPSTESRRGRNAAGTSGPRRGHNQPLQRTGRASRSS